MIKGFDPKETFVSHFVKYLHKFSIKNIRRKAFSQLCWRDVL